LLKKFSNFRLTWEYNLNKLIFFVYWFLLGTKLQKFSATLDQLWIYKNWSNLHNWISKNYISKIFFFYNELWVYDSSLQSTILIMIIPYLTPRWVKQKSTLGSVSVILDLCIYHILFFLFFKLYRVIHPCPILSKTP